MPGTHNYFGAPTCLWRAIDDDATFNLPRTGDRLFDYDLRVVDARCLDRIGKLTSIRNFADAIG